VKQRLSVSSAAGVVALILLSSVPFTANAARGKSCAPVPDVLPTGVQPAWAVNVRASGTSCRIARRLPKKVILNFRYGSLNPSKYGASALGIAAWRCNDHGGNGGWTAPVTCTASRGRHVSWRLADTP
jgi:hypothetical protein